jgi:hypothetical protein
MQLQMRFCGSVFIADCNMSLEGEKMNILFTLYLEIRSNQLKVQLRLVNLLLHSSKNPVKHATAADILAVFEPPALTAKQLQKGKTPS